jgi:hypothetical protein
MKLLTNRLFNTIISLVLLFTFGCASTGVPQQPQVQQQAGQRAEPLPAQPQAPASPYYTGDGGWGMSLAILAPRATGLAENQGYIPALVQGEFVANFSGYSAISVMDRENLDNIYAELLSGYYSDDDEAGLDLGHLTATDYKIGRASCRERV